MLSSGLPAWSIGSAKDWQQAFINHKSASTSQQPALAGHRKATMAGSRRSRDPANKHDSSTSSSSSSEDESGMDEKQSGPKTKKRKGGESGESSSSDKLQRENEELKRQLAEARELAKTVSSSSVGSSLSSSTGVPGQIQVVTRTVAEKTKLPRVHQTGLNTFVKCKGFDLWPILQSKHLRQNPQMVNDMLDDLNFPTQEDRVACTKICKQWLLKNINELRHNKKSAIRDKCKRKLPQWWWDKLVP